MKRLREYAANLTDRLEHHWEQHFMKNMVGTVLVVTFLAMIVLIELNRRLIFPEPFGSFLTDNHFFAVEFVFTLLLITEVISLIFSLGSSFSRSIGIQLELLSLILLRDTFKKFKDFGEPLQWELVQNDILPMVAEVAAALAIFVILGFYYRQLKSRPITDDEKGMESFIKSKKMIALGLVIIFATTGIVDLFLWITNQETYPFFETFYTVLIFTDVLMVLLSLRYSTVFAVTFRNFAFSLVTVFIRLALIAPVPINAAIGVGVAFFALAVAVSYNQYGRDIVMKGNKQTEEHAPLQGQGFRNTPQYNAPAAEA